MYTCFSLLSASAAFNLFCGKEKRKKEKDESISAGGCHNFKGRGEQEASGPTSLAQTIPAEYSGLWFSTCNKTGLCWRVTSRVAKEGRGKKDELALAQVLVLSLVASSTSPPSPFHLQSPGEYR